MKNKKTQISLFIIFLVSIIYLACNNSVPVETRNEPATSPVTEQKRVPHTTYHEYFHEDTLRYGIRFGMTVTEWNKLFARLAKNNTVKELSNTNASAKENPYSIYKAFRAFVPFDNSEGINRERNGFYISGLFITTEYKQDTVQIFKLDNRIIDESILIGIQIDYDVPTQEIKEVLNILIEKDQLDYIAGPRNFNLSYAPLAVSDFKDPVEASMLKFAKEHGGSSSSDNYSSKTLTQTALFEGRLFNSSIELTETRNASVMRNTDYEIYAINDAYRTYQLKQRLFSKKQFKLDIEQFMTLEQRKNFENSKETDRLIQSTLK